VRTALGKLTHLRDLEVHAAGDVVRVTATVNGDIDAVVKEIARHRVVDLAVEEPDLEESVLSLYGGDRA
jgi:ABC-2 type transport system ATP-binding protein